MRMKQISLKRSIAVGATSLLALTALLLAPVSLAQETWHEAYGEALERGEYQEALQQVQPMAHKGVPEAQFSLGRMYAWGQGVEKDMAEAVSWYRKAAEQGLAEAQFQLGEAYARGEGVPRDYVIAYVWMSRAAVNGDRQAKPALASYADLMSEAQLQEAKRQLETNRERTGN